MIHDEEMRIEGSKLFHETVKQLITISSGSILVMFALLEKVFSSPRWRVLLAIAFVGFLICIVAGLAMMRRVSLELGSGYTKSRHFRVTYGMANVFFLSAVTALI